MDMGRKIPDALIQSLEQLEGFDSRTFLQVHALNEPLCSIRLNPEKSSSGFTNEQVVPWNLQGRYLKERPLFTADPLFHAGCYYVQEASSMFLSHVLKQTVDLSSRLRVLDLCAAPGGKSTLISSLLNSQSLLLANEIIKSRIPILSDNLTKWGKLNTYISQNDPRDFSKLPSYFDLIVADAPCSGSGMFRKDPEAITEWSEEAVNLCSQRQQRILADVYPALKKDGVLVYSTCSYSEAENEAISDWLSKNFALESIRLKIDPAWGIVETQSNIDGNWGYRFYPHLLKGEGFFLACFRKKEGDLTQDVKIRKQEPIKIPVKHLEELNRWISSDSISIRPFQDGYLAIPSGHVLDLSLLQERLYLKKSGTRLGKFAGNDLIPDHELALSIAASDTIQRIALTREQAISYLKKEELRLETDTRGWALMCFEGFGLGWAKILPTRINNYYPKEQRIFDSSIS